MNKVSSCFIFIKVPILVDYVYEYIFINIQQLLLKKNTYVRKQAKTLNPNIKATGVCTAKCTWNLQVL